MILRLQFPVFRDVHFSFSSKSYRQNRLHILILATGIFYFGCSVPNLEEPECIQSRETVKQFYSIHFGNDLTPSSDKLGKSENFLSRRLFQELKNQTENAKDYFTQTEDYPKAFRVGGCDVVSSNQTNFEVLLFWRNETRSEQREIKVNIIKEKDKWVIDKVENKQ